MKKVFLVLMVSLVSFVSNAQFKKSDKILEGTVSYSKSEGSDAEYSISPKFGLFLSDKFAVGVGVGFGQNADDGDVTELGAYGRYYFLNVGKNLVAYTELGVASNTTKLSGEKVSSFSANIGVGANYFISKRLALSAHVCDLMNYTSVESSSSFNLGFLGVDNPLAMGRFGLLIRL